MLEIMFGILLIYCIALNIQINRLKYFAKYGSPKCEKNISSLWSMAEESKEKINELGGRVRDLEYKEGMHPPHVQL
jgi:hypothetical protein